MDLTVVMYHYVRDLERSRYPLIKGLRTAEFRQQLEHLRRNYTVVRMEDVVAAFCDAAPLPPRAALLTFDDGYIDHYVTAFPLLREFGFQGAFFPPAGAVVRGELLDVNRIHFLLASLRDPLPLVAAIDAFVREHQATHGLDNPAEYWTRWGQPNRFDTAEVIYIKRMLQVALPRELRNQLARQLFAQVVSVDEAAFAQELYVTVEQLRVMRECGMHVGCHGDAHEWLNSLDRPEQARDIDAALLFLRAVGVLVDEGWTIAYPYGGWNESLLDVLMARGCRLGFTTEATTALVGQHRPLSLPRWDTNDLPPRGQRARAA
jgi:peptidoglycan/xylan/chitin deacetylase (PgdA/CDA1 family)